VAKNSCSLCVRANRDMPGHAEAQVRLCGDYYFFFFWYSDGTTEARCTRRWSLRRCNIEVRHRNWMNYLNNIRDLGFMQRYMLRGLWAILYSLVSQLTRCSPKVQMYNKRRKLGYVCRLIRTGFDHFSGLSFYLLEFSLEGIPPQPGEISAVV